MFVGGRGAVVALAIVVFVLAVPAVASADTFDEVQTLQPPDGATGDWFGQSVAVSGNTMVVGAPADKDGTAYQYGAAFVYSQTSPGAWTLERTFDPTVGDDHDDEFGSAVAVDPDGTIVVGAVNEDTKPSTTSVETGAAWVFQPNGSGGYTSQELTGSTQDLAEFGESVAIQGTTVVVGAEQDSSNGSINDLFGAAYVYTQPAAGHSFAQAAKLTPSDEQNEDEFGGAVAISGRTILVGSPNYEVDGEAQAGLVFSYNEASTADNWAAGDLTETQLAGPSGAGLFGDALAVATSPVGGGTFESGTTTLVVGAPGTQEGSTVDVGAAFVYDLPANGDIADLSDEAKLQPTVSADTTPEYGNAVGVDGGTIGVAPSTLGNETYAYSEPAGGWSSNAPGTAVEPASPSGPLGDGGVAVSGDVFALGASDNETANGQSSTTSGFVYVFDQPATKVAVKLSPDSIPANGTSKSTATATVTDAAGDLASNENVKFSASDSGVGISSVTNDGNGTYTATITSDTTPGNVTITATDNTPNPAVSGHATLVQTGVQKPGTGTSVASSVNPSVAGQAVTFTATVSPGAGGQGSPTGTVTFYANGSELGTAALSTAGGVSSASYTISSLAVGATQIYASYGGDADYGASSSQDISQIVAPAPTAVRLGRVSTNGITATVPVSCAAPARAPCRFTVKVTITEFLHLGKLTAITAAKKHGSKSRTKTVTLGTARIDLTGGEHKNVHITLNRTGRRLLSARHHFRAKVAVAESGKTIASTKITFRVDLHPKRTR